MRSLPSWDFFVPSSVRSRRFRRFVESQATRGYPLHLTHSRCLDGAVSDVLVRMSVGGVETIFVDPPSTLRTLEILAQVQASPRDLLISDLSPRKDPEEAQRMVKALGELSARGWRIRWWDHHARQWEGFPLDSLKGIAEITIDVEGKECAASLVQRALLGSDPFARELAFLARDYDLWIRSDRRSEDLHLALSNLGSRAFVQRVLESRSLKDPLLAESARRERERVEALVRVGVQSARFFRRGRWVVAATYGDLPTNNVLHDLLQKGAHVALLSKPEGRGSLRSLPEVKVCHKVAQLFGGGGHPNASGLTLPVRGVGFLEYWIRRSSSLGVRRVVEGIFEALEDLEKEQESSRGP